MRTFHAVVDILKLTILNEFSEPDNDAPQEMGSAADQELTEEDEDKLCSIKQEAVAAFADGDYSKAVSHFTEAIKMNSSSALMFAKRANWYGVLLKQN